MITQIEQKIVDRLKRGLGKMVRTVKSYRGEADDLAGQIMTLPAVWITFGGCKVEPSASGQQRYQNIGEFVVMCATRSLRSETAMRQGGVRAEEVANNELVEAVRRLLDGQRLGGADSRGLMPKAIRPIANHVLVQNAAVSLFAVEYNFYWSSYPLENDRFADEQSTHPEDAVFARYHGEHSPAYPDFKYFDSLVFDPELTASVPSFLELKK